MNELQLLPSLHLPAADTAKRVVALRGLPGSGKSTAALHALSAHPTGSTVRINNDDLVAGLLGSADTGLKAPGVPALLADARHRLLQAALRNPEVRLVIIDNTNLNLRTVHELHETAALAGAAFGVDDTFLRVTVEECIARDAARERTVGPSVINRMAKQAARLGPYRPTQRIIDLTTPVAVYDNDPTLPSTVLVDIDGTLALNTSGRSFYDWQRVGEDTPNKPVVDVVRLLIAAGQHVTIMSGRDSVCRPQTQAWLDEHVGVNLPLYMRAERDQRTDYIVKLELFNEHVAGRFHVKHVLDDRDQVIRLWRKLGLSTWQVAEGDF